MIKIFNYNKDQDKKLTIQQQLSTGFDPTQHKLTVAAMRAVCPLASLTSG